MASYHEKTVSAVKNLEAKKNKTARLEERLREMEAQVKKAREEESVAAAKEILKRMKNAHLTVEELFDLIEQNAKESGTIEEIEK